MISVLLSRLRHLAWLWCQGQDTFRHSQAVVLLCSRLQAPRGEVDHDIWWAKIIRLNPRVCNKRAWARKKGRRWEPSFWGDKPQLPQDYKALLLLPWMGGLTSSSRDLLVLTPLSRAMPRLFFLPRQRIHQQLLAALGAASISHETSRSLTLWGSHRKGGCSELLQAPTGTSHIIWS